MKTPVFLVLVFVVSGMILRSAERSKITTSQAKELVLASLTPQQRRLPKLELVPLGDLGSSKFRFFTVTWEGFPKGSVVVGNYAVDPYTGDVFSAVASCYEMNSKALQAIQRQIRASLHLSKAEYERLKTKGPLCEE